MPGARPTHGPKRTPRRPRRRRPAHQQTQVTLRKQQARLLDHAFDPILTWEPGRGITFWNAGADRLYGYTAAEAVGRAAHELLQTVFPDGRAAFDEALRRDGHWEGEVRHRTREGGWVTVDSRTAVVDGSSGLPEVLEANRDVTREQTGGGGGAAEPEAPA